MKILMIDTFYYPRGGSSLYVFSLSELLRARGHEVFHFAMEHPNSLESETRRFWAPNIDYPELLKKGILKNGLKVLKRTIYSSESARNLQNMIIELGPFDIAHVHNIMHYLTPSVFDPLIDNRIPIIWTLHDFSILCPNTNFFDENRGRSCTKCLRGGIHFLNAVFSRCKKNSFAASSMAALEAWSHRFKGRWNKPDLFVSPSQFLAKMLMEAGFNRDKIEIVPNFVKKSPTTEREIVWRNPYALYAGRLSPEKGVQSAIAAWKTLPDEYLLKIAGTGPDEVKLKSLAGNAKNIEFCGFVQPSELAKLRKGALFSLVPSVCIENAPLAILESFSDGLPVLASRIGGIPEIVEEGKTGLLFEPGNAADILLKAKGLFGNPERCAEFGKNAREKYLAEFDPEQHIKKIEAIYRRFTTS